MFYIRVLNSKSIKFEMINLMRQRKRWIINCTKGR